MVAKGHSGFGFVQCIVVVGKLWSGQRAASGGDAAPQVTVEMNALPTMPSAHFASPTSMITPESAKANATAEVTATVTVSSTAVVSATEAVTKTEAVTATESVSGTGAVTTTN